MPVYVIFTFKISMSQKAVNKLLVLAERLASLASHSTGKYWICTPKSF